MELTQQAPTVVPLVYRYAPGFCRVVPTEGSDNLVCSPLGAWLAAATVAAVTRDESVASALGCTVDEATEGARSVLDDTPAAMHTAIAIWVRETLCTVEPHVLARRLPQATVTAMPSQTGAAEWASLNTDGMIEQFPLEITDLTGLVIANALATDVKWPQPLDVVPANLLVSGPWSDSIDGVLASSARDTVQIADTDAAGRVGVHSIVSRDGIRVTSVIADEDTAVQHCLTATHDVAESLTGDNSRVTARSLFDLPVGAGHAWDIVERTILGQPGQVRAERASAVLPAWDAQTDEFDLKDARAPAVVGALGAMEALLREQPADTSAVQSAKASFGREGFKAAQVTAFGVAPTASPMPAPVDEIPLRQAEVRFHRPYAVVATVDDRSDLAGLPLFAAWIQEPADAGTPDSIPVDRGFTDPRPPAPPPPAPTRRP